MQIDKISNLAPKILVVACNWDGWSCIEAVVNAGLKYPSSVQVVRVNCLSRVHAGLMLQALDIGAEGLMLLGCEPERCHFSNNSDCVKKEYEKAQTIMELLGIEKNRLILVRLPAFSGQKFVTKLLKFSEEIKQTLKSANTGGIGIEATAK